VFHLVKVMRQQKAGVSFKAFGLAFEPSSTPASGQPKLFGASRTIPKLSITS
jgi:hypothetical protein